MSDPAPISHSRRAAGRRRDRTQMWLGIAGLALSLVISTLARRADAHVLAVLAFGVGALFLALLIWVHVSPSLRRRGRDGPSGGGDDLGGGRGPRDPARDPGPGSGQFAWDAFEREFAAYVAARERELVPHR
jgi:hypothetical protein